MESPRASLKDRIPYFSNTQTKPFKRKQQTPTTDQRTSFASQAKLTVWLSKSHPPLTATDLDLNLNLNLGVISNTTGGKRPNI